MSRIITAIDLGNGSFKVIVAEQKKEGGLSVLSAFKRPSAGFRRGVLVDFDEAYEALDDIFKDIKKISKRAAENVFINLQSGYIKTRFTRGAIAISSSDKEIKEEDVEKVDKLALAFKSGLEYKPIHNFTKEYIIDDIGDITDPEGMQGNRLEVEKLIIEGVTFQINQILELFNALGISLEDPVFNPVAAANSILSKRQKNLGVLLIDFGFGNTNIALFEEGKLIYAKTITLGSSYITNDIAIGLRIPVEVAEKLKVNLGEFSSSLGKRDIIKLSDIDENLTGEISRRFLNEIITIRLSEILDLVESEIKAVGRTVQLPAGVVATGGGAKLYKLEEMLKNKLKLPVQIGYPNLNNIEVLNPSLRELVEDPEFATVVGLLLTPLESAKKEKMSKGFFKNLIRNLLPF